MIGITNTEVSQNIKCNLLPKKWNLRVIDYDGSIIDEQLLERNQVYTIPNPPVHQGLVFDGWYCVQTISNNQVTMGDDIIIIVAFYTTESGYTEFDIDLTENTVSNKEVFVTSSGNYTDWGDGTINTQSNHVYSSYGNYTIKRDITRLDGTYSSSGYYPCVFNTSGYIVRAIRMSNNITQLGDRALINSSKIKYISFSKNITSISTYALSSVPMKVMAFPLVTSFSANAFYNCAYLNCILAPNVTSIGNQCFYNNYTLFYVKLSDNLNSIGTQSFYYCQTLKEVNIININSLPNYAFYQCPSLSNVTISYNGDITIGTYVFYYCYLLKSVKIDGNILSIGQYAFYSCKCAREYSFKGCTSVPALSNINAFNNISPLCKIKVPWNLYQDWKVATNWSTYADHLDGGTPATINFTGDNTGDIYVNGNLISGTTTTWIGPNMPYSVYDPVNNIVFSQTATGIAEGSTQNINIDLSSKKRITLRTSANGLFATFTINGKVYYATEDNGDYYINVIGSGITIDYYINGGVDYADVTGTVSTTGSDMVENITLSSATWTTFSRPNLTANGTLGGDSFAVYAKSISESSYPAWKAVDSDTSSSYWMTSSSDKDYTFYNPKSLKVTRVVLSYQSSSTATEMAIQGSNDNINWESIESTYTLSSSTGTLTVTLASNKCYKYYKLVLVKSSMYTRVLNIQITAQVKN